MEYSLVHNSPYARIRHCPYFSVLNRTLSVSCSTVWGVQDGRIYMQCDEQVGAAAFIYV